MTENQPIPITDDDFDQKVLKSEGIALVDFWAPWCGPCYTMAPALEAFATANPGKVKVFKLDSEDNPKMAEQYEIRTIPTSIFFRDGEPVDTLVGAVGQSVLQEKLDALLSQ
ncbi:MAG: thioredoxin [Deltaproteobacteria bacterium]|nr:thioredoxin [Deltaproteobacteria bacterium]